MTCPFDLHPEMVPVLRIWIRSTYMTPQCCAALLIEMITLSGNDESLIKVEGLSIEGIGRAASARVSVMQVGVCFLHWLIKRNFRGIRDGSLKFRLGVRSRLRSS